MGSVKQHSQPFWIKGVTNEISLPLNFTYKGAPSPPPQTKASSLFVILASVLQGIKERE